MKHDNDLLTPFELFTPVLIALILACVFATDGAGLAAAIAYTWAAFMACAGVACIWEAPAWDGDL